MIKILIIKKEKTRKRRRITKDPKTNNKNNKQNKNKIKNKMRIRKWREKWMKKNKNQRAREIL